MTNFRFPKRMRLLTASDFERVFQARRSAGDEFVVLYGAANNLQYPRLGLAVSRKVGGAVARNRWKRALREAFRLAQHDLPPLDLVCIPRAGAKPSVAHVRRSFLTLSKRILRQLERDNERCAEKKTAELVEDQPANDPAS